MASLDRTAHLRAALQTAQQRQQADCTRFALGAARSPARPGVAALGNGGSR
jgi:hypothetical protein